MAMDPSLTPVFLAKASAAAGMMWSAMVDDPDIGELGRRPAPAVPRTRAMSRHPNPEVPRPPWPPPERESSGLIRMEASLAPEQCAPLSEEPVHDCPLSSEMCAARRRAASTADEARRGRGSSCRAAGQHPPRSARALAAISERGSGGLPFLGRSSLSDMLAMDLSPTHLIGCSAKQETVNRFLYTYGESSARQGVRTSLNINSGSELRLPVSWTSGNRPCHACPASEGDREIRHADTKRW